MPIWKSILTRADAVAALMVLAAIVAAALLAPVVFPDGPWRMVARPFQLPFQDMVHPLGADALGRDMLAMMMYGFQSFCRGISSQDRASTTGKKMANSTVGNSIGPGCPGD